jgi:DNA-binding CsgD family transcriptional regulator
MAQSHRLRLGDVRAVYLLVGECRDLGADPVAWQTHLLGGLLRALSGAVGAAFESDPAAGPRPPGDPLRPSSLVDCGWAAPGDSRRFQQLIREGTPDRNPMLPVVLARPGPVRTFTRRELLTDREYYGNEYVAGYMRETNLDDFVGVCYFPGPGHSVHLGVNRFRGERPFGIRERRLLHLCGVEIVRLHGTRLAPGVGPSVSRLAPRLRQVLLCLCEGDGEKQVAARLRISAHTVHEYVRRLHRHFGVSSRGELLARCSPLLPILRGSPTGLDGHRPPADGHA